MSKFRYINTKFWDDEYIINLDPIEKLMYMYFITNPMTNICGIYEITIKRIGFDTGLDRDMVLKILARFEKDDKVYYRNGWIGIKNWIKNQKQSDKPNDNINIGIKRVLEIIPEDMKNLVLNGIKRLEAPYNPLEILEPKLELKPEPELITKPAKILFLEVVKLTQIQYDTLVEQFGKAKVDDLITRLNNYIQSVGKKYTSHYHTILNWERKDNGNSKDKKGQVKNDDDWEYDKLPQGSMVTGKEKTK